MTLFGGAIVGAALLLTVFGLDRLANRVTTPDTRPMTPTVPELGMAHEDLVVESGRVSLHAWLLDSPEAQPFEPLLVLAHGWSANYSTVLLLAEPLVRAGHDVIVFDVRGHGRNEATAFVTIRDFRDDLVAITRYAAKRFPDRQLVLVGHSMGGAAGVLAAADGAPIDGLVLIAAPADVLRVTAEYLSDRGLPGRLMVNLLRPFFWRRVGGSFRPLTPGRRIRDVDVPMLLIQPENDGRVDRWHAETLAQAAGLPINVVPDREHTDVLAAPRTLQLIETFLESL